MQHTTKTLGLVAIAMTAGVVALAAVRSVCSESQKASSLPQSREATKTVNEKFQKEMDEANKRESIANKKAQQLFEEGRLAEAEKACYRALAFAPKVKGEPFTTTAKRLLGDIYQAQGRHKDAIDAYVTSRKYTFDNEETDLKIALCYLRLGDMENAHKSYTEKKFYSVERFLGGTTAKQKADDFSMLPGDKTPRTMEASLLYTLGAEKSLHSDAEEANALFKKTLELAPRNALAARYIAWNLDFLGKRDESVPYWARAAVFGKGYIAEQGKIELNNHLMPDKIEQALRDAQKIQ